MLRLIRVGHAWNDPEVRSQIAFFGEIINVANDRQQNAAAQSSNPLDADQIRVALQLLTFLGDRLFQFGDTLVQAADLVDDDFQFEIDENVELHGQNSSQSFFTGQGFFAEIDAVRRAQIVNLVL